MNFKIIPWIHEFSDCKLSSFKKVALSWSFEPVIARTLFSDLQRAFKRDKAGKRILKSIADMLRAANRKLALRYKNNTKILGWAY